jgi:hypothetical protein
MSVTTIRKKMNTFMVLDVLKKHSDEKNPIASQEDIIALVEIEFGIMIDRHALSSILTDLISY